MNTSVGSWVLRRRASVRWAEQLGWIDLQGASQLMNVDEADVALAPLHARDVRGVEPRAERQLGLRQTGRCSQLPQSLAEVSLHTLRCLFLAQSHGAKTLLVPGPARP